MSTTACNACPLRALPLFVEHEGADLALVQSLKRREVTWPAGTALIHEGQADTPLFTLLQGWAFRYKTLSDGRRQILNFLLAGDLIGVQQKMSDSAAHGVTLLTDARLCVFDRDALWALHRERPTLGFRVTWLVAHEESLVDDHLLSIGRRSAEERVATALVLLYKRAAALRPAGGAGAATGAPSDAEPDTTPGVPFPLTQQHLADALGLSLAHTHKTLRRIEQRGLFRWRDERLVLLDPKALARLADLYGDGKPAPRPLI
jgi:CRP-like cAMP-binding protein